MNNPYPNIQLPSMFQASPYALRYRTDGAPLTIPHYSKMIRGVGKGISIGGPWINYFHWLNPDDKAWGKFLDADWGPTQGKNNKGLIKLQMLGYGGNPFNVLEIRRFMGVWWARIETMPITGGPDYSITRTSHPWLIHECFGSNHKGTPVKLVHPVFAPLIGDAPRWVDLKNLVPMEAK